jgi:hypothetical protein
MKTYIIGRTTTTYEEFYIDADTEEQAMKAAKRGLGYVSEASIEKHWDLKVVNVWEKRSNPK